MAEDYGLAAIFTTADGADGFETRLGDAAILLKIPDVLIAGGFDAEILEEVEFEGIQFGNVVVANVDEDDFRFCRDAGERLVKGPFSVDDFDAVFILDVGEVIGIGGIAQAIEPGIENLRAVKTILNGSVGGEEGAEENVAANFRTIGFGCDQAVKNKRSRCLLIFWTASWVT